VRGAVACSCKRDGPATRMLSGARDRTLKRAPFAEGRGATASELSAVARPRSSLPVPTTSQVRVTLRTANCGPSWLASGWPGQLPGTWFTPNRATTTTRRRHQPDPPTNKQHDNRPALPTRREAAINQPLTGRVHITR